MTRLSFVACVLLGSVAAHGDDLNTPKDFRAEVARRVNLALTVRADAASVRRGTELALLAFDRRVESDVARMRTLNTNPQRESWTPTVEAVVADIAKNANVYGGAEQAQIVIDAVVRANSAYLALQQPGTVRSTRALRVLSAIEETGLGGLRETASDLYREAFAGATDTNAMTNLLMRASHKGITPPPLSPEELVEAIAKAAQRFSAASATFDTAEGIGRMLQAMKPSVSNNPRWGAPPVPEVIAKPERAFGLIARTTLASAPTKAELLYAAKLIKSSKFPESERARAERAAYVATLKDATLRTAVKDNADWEALRKRVEFNRGAERLAKLEAGVALPPFASGSEVRDFVSALVIDVQERFPEGPKPYGEALYSILNGTLPSKDVGDFLARELARLASPDSGVSPKVLEYILGQMLPELMRLPTSGEASRNLVDALEKRATTNGGDSLELRRLRGEAYRHAFASAKNGMAWGGVLSTLLGGQARTSPFSREDLGSILASGLRRKDWKSERGVDQSLDFVLRMADDAKGFKWGTFAERFPQPPPLTRETLVRALTAEVSAAQDAELTKTVQGAIRGLSDTALGGKPAADALKAAVTPSSASGPAPKAGGPACDPKKMAALVR